MDVFIIKAFDRYLGALVCFVLSFFKRKKSAFSTRKILLIQLWGIGETILTLPTVRAVRKKLPKSVICVLATARNKTVYECTDCIDEIFEVRLSAYDLVRFVIKHYNEFDVALDMEEYLNISSILCFFLGKYRVGYANQKRSSLYDKTVAYDDNQHVALTYFDLARQIGVNAKIDSLEPLLVDKKTKLEVEKILRTYMLSKQDFLVGLGIGAAESSKCRKWPKDRFAAVADLLVKKYHAKIVFVGSQSESEEIDDIIGRMDSSKLATNLAGKTSVKQLFWLIGKLDLFVGNDSGPMHIAASQKVPTVGLFGPNLPRRFGPFGRMHRAIYKGEICSFSPCINVHLGQVPDCLFPKKSEDYQKCMKNITVQDVIKVITEVQHERKNQKSR